MGKIVSLLNRTCTFGCMVGRFRSSF